LAPAGPVSLKVQVRLAGDYQAEFLGATSHRLLYVVRNADGTVQTSGAVGPFASAVPSGTIDLSLDNVLVGTGTILSVQLNDATPVPELPLAIGAMDLGASAFGGASLTLDLGSVQRNCYFLNTTSMNFGSTYGFGTDILTSGVSIVSPNHDIRINYYAGIAYPLTITDAQSVPQPTISYLGNGDLVDFCYVPPVTSFAANSALAKGGVAVATGDVFCITPPSLPGAHVWVQVADVGNGTLYQSAKLRFRVNTTVPYYAYERTAPDIASACATMW
jgi:hypothetical protein